jgi:hypothetical protein
MDCGREEEEGKKVRWQGWGGGREPKQQRIFDGRQIDSAISSDFRQPKLNKASNKITPKREN